MHSVLHSPQVLQHPDAHNSSVSCGVFCWRTLWCGCGRYLIGLDPNDFLMKHYQPIIKEQGANASFIAASHSHIWVGFKNQSYLMVCTATKPSDMEMLDCQ